MQHEPDDFTSLEGKKIIRRMSVEYISFAAHVEYVSPDLVESELNHKSFRVPSSP